MDKQQDKGIWIFLSHSNEDYDKVRKVRNILEEQELRPIMFFLKCLNDDDEIDELIKREIDCRTRFILCDSENSRKSKWVQREIEYIRSQQKPYEIIDLSRNENEILYQLKEVRRRSKLFISYARKDQALAAHIYNRLSKYDYDVFIDYNNLLFGESFATKIKEEIESTVESGCVIALLTKDALQSGWVNHEIEFAREYDKIHNLKRGSVIPVVIGKDVPENLADLQCIKISSETNDLPDIIVDAILTRLLSPGEILTYYNNFKKGINCQKDLNESERLGNLYFSLAEKFDAECRPTAIVALGHCYEFGIGTEIDLEKAYYQYSDYASNDGLGREQAKRVHRKLYPEQYILTPKESGFKKILHRMFTRLKNRCF